MICRPVSIIEGKTRACQPEDKPQQLHGRQNLSLTSRKEQTNQGQLSTQAAQKLFSISANMPTWIGLANLCQIISYDYIFWHSGSPTHSQGILRLRRPRSLSNKLRITLHYGTNQRGPTIKVPLAVALVGQSCILNQGLGGSNLVSKNTGG